MGALSKLVGKAILKDTKRGATKEALKEEFKDKGMTELQATNKAHREMAKEAGKKTAIEKVDVKQDRDTSKFKAADSKGGNKTLAVQARDLDRNKFVSMKRESDEGSTVRSVAERQKLREAGEKMFKAGVKEEVKKTAKQAAGVAAVSVVAGKEIGEGIKERREAKEKEEKKDTKEMNKGGMVKANCGASMPPAQKAKK
jgi:hypothetical protein